MTDIDAKAREIATRIDFKYIKVGGVLLEKKAGEIIAAAIREAVAEKDDEIERLRKRIAKLEEECDDLGGRLWTKEMGGEA